MRTLLPLIAMALLFLTGCRKKPDFTVKVLTGATTIPAAGEAAIEDSVIVIGGSKIRAVGPQKDTAVPKAADRTDLTGEWVVPAEGSRIEPGETANLRILRHAPNGIQPAAPGDLGASIVAGEWKLK